MKTSVIAQTAAASFCGGPDSYREPQKIQRMAGLATNYYNDFFTYYRPKMKFCEW